MLDWSGIIALAAQACCAAITVEQFRRHIFPSLHQLRLPDLLTDVWAPLVIAVPMLFFLGSASGSVDGPAWVGTGGPIACAVIGLGGAMIVNQSQIVTLGTSAIVMCTGAGVILLMLGAAHHLTLWMGQCAFALAAALLWRNTPDDRETSPEALTPMQVRTGVALTIAVLAAVAQGAASLMVIRQNAAIGGGIAIAGGALIVLAAARFGGADAAIRISCWLIVYGVLLAMGVLSLLKLIPAAYQAAQEGFAPPIQRVAHGFGIYWIEATEAMFFAGAAYWLMRFPSGLRRIAGLGLVAAAALLAAWRLLQI